MTTPRSALLPAVALTLLNRGLLRAGLRKRTDGWRRAAGLMLRGEHSTFVLSAFSLEPWSDGPRPAAPTPADTQSHIARRLAAFLATEPAAHVRVRRGEFLDVPEPTPSPSYTLAFHPWRDGAARFAIPTSWGGVPASPPDADPAFAPLMNIVCRIGDRSRADLWLRINHAALDGVPMQDLLTRLESAWGLAESVEYPTPEAFAPYAKPRPCPGRPGISEVQTFVDFSQLLAWRKAKNANLPEPMTLNAAILWWLARHETLANIHLGTTAEVGESRGLAPGVGVVITQPNRYDNHNGGLAHYVHDFNTGLDLARRRASASLATLDAAARIPPRLEAALLKHALSNTPNAFGAAALTMLKDAKVFGAPIADFGHDRGFLAIGSVNLPAPNARRVGCVTIKCADRFAQAYPTLLREAFANCAT